MQVIRADVLGMCFGVRDALAAMDRIDNPGTITIHGELVHNEKVLEHLQERGFHMTGEGHRTSLPLTETVLITAHGISEKERRRLERGGKRLIDTTCPLVRRAHEAAQALQRDGYHVLVIGTRGHVEVQGIVEDLESYDVVPSPADVRSYPQQKIGVMCQTTTPVAHAERILQRIRAQNPDAEICFRDTICHPTKDHQQALELLLDQAPVVIVVGGRNSNNTKQLVRRCEERGVRAYHIQDADDLCPQWFEGVAVVGLTAGTSTLEKTIRDVETRLVAMTAASVPARP